MKLIVITPESDEPREHAVLAALFAAGLERCHVRKPQWPREKLAAWLAEIPSAHRPRLVLHEHHALAAEFGCGGVHFKEVADLNQVEPALRAGSNRHGVPVPPRNVQTSDCVFTSRSCHTLSSLDAALGRYDSVFLSPIFPSISKPGYAPTLDLAAVAARLARRTADERRTAVIALGGITSANAARCAELGFDGVAVLGALWMSADPLKVFNDLQQMTSDATEGRARRPRRAVSANATSGIARRAATHPEGLQGRARPLGAPLDQVGRGVPAEPDSDAAHPEGSPCQEKPHAA